MQKCAEKLPVVGAASEGGHFDGACGQHHGEFVQGLMRWNGRLDIACISLKLGALRTVATYRPGGRFQVEPPHKVKTRRACLAFFRRHHLPPTGRIRLATHIPEGMGLGSSTGDIVSALRALQAAYGQHLPPDDLAALALAAEGAVDPLMHEAAVLFLPRRGRVVRELPALKTGFLLLSIALGSGGVDTLSLGLAEYVSARSPLCNDLFEAFEDAVARDCLPEVGRIATESALRHQALRSAPAVATALEIGRAFGAMGIQVAHTGNVAGLMLPLDSHWNRLAEALGAQGIPVRDCFVVGTA